MIPQLGAPLGLLVASGLFAYFLLLLSPGDFLDWGWRYPFFVVLAINVVALFARLRLVATPEFQRLFESRELQPAPVGETIRLEGRTVVLGAFAPLASFALFHLVTVFPLSWVVLFNGEAPVRFLLIEMAGAVAGVLSIMASGLITDRVGRRAVLGVSAVLIGAYSGFAPQLLNAGAFGQTVYMLGGFVLLGLSFGQSSGAVNSNFSPMRRYTGAAITANLAWLIGAGFAPLVALTLSSRFRAVVRRRLPVVWGGLHPHRPWGSTRNGRARQPSGGAGRGPRGPAHGGGDPPPGGPVLRPRPPRPPARAGLRPRRRRGDEAWAAHLARIADFWSSLVLRSGRYQGDPFSAHLRLLPELEPAMFDRWLALFRETCGELFHPDAAHLFQDRAERVARSLRMGLFERLPARKGP